MDDGREYAGVQTIDRLAGAVARICVSLIVVLEIGTFIYLF